MSIDAIVAGGQTGADRAALEFARAAGIPIRGWIPNGRAAEDGPISFEYEGLTECDSSDPAVRTRLNVRDSDGTVIFSHGPLHGGSALAAEEAKHLSRPLLHVDLERMTLVAGAAVLGQWLQGKQIKILNVAGPRASDDGGIFVKTLVVLGLALLGE